MSLGSRVTVFVVLLAAGLALLLYLLPLWSAVEPPEPGVPAARIEEAPDSAPRPPASRAPSEPAAEAVEAEIQFRAADLRPTRLELSVLWRADRRPVPDLGVSALAPNARPARVRAVTDAAGRASFLLGEVQRATLHAALGQRREVELAAGERNVVEWLLEGEPCVRGVVRDEHGAPVPHARILVSGRFEYDVFGNAFDLLHEEYRSSSRRRMRTGRPFEDDSTRSLPEALLWLESTVATCADEQGVFVLRGDLSRRYVAAFAPLRIPSQHFYVEACGEGSLDLVLGPGGADVVGRVLDAHGRPAAHCDVACGSTLSGVWSRDEKRRYVAPPRPRFTTTDADGRFELEGLSAGSTPILIQLDGVGACRETVELQPDVRHTLAFQLEPAAGIEGRITDASGAPVSAARVEAYSRFNPFSSYVAVDQEGRFALSGLRSGPTGLWVDGGEAGEAHRQLRLEPGQVARCDVALEGVATLRLRIVDERGNPLVGFRAERMREQSEHRTDAFRLMIQPETAWTDADGRVVLACEKRPPAVDVYHSAQPSAPFLAARFRDVEPGAEWKELAVEDRLLVPGSVAVRVVDPKGEPVAGCNLRLRQTDGTVPFRLGYEMPFEMARTTDASGAASFGPVPASELELSCHESRWTATGVTSVRVGSGEDVDFGELLVVAERSSDER